MYTHTHIRLDALKVMRDALRDLGKRQILTDAQYDALAHAEAKLAGEGESCSSFPRK